MSNLVTNLVRVIIPDGYEAAKQVTIGDIPAKQEALRLRKEFNTSVMYTLKEFSRNNNLVSEVDFSNSSVNFTGFSLDCSPRFEEAVKQAAIPHIGVFMKNGPLLKP